MDPEYMDDPFLRASMPPNHMRVSAMTGLPFSVSSPKVAQIFNIFYPSDPISYRLEPLISTAMSSLKPQPLPYTKRGIFGSIAPQSLTGIGVKVGQSVSQGVSDLWSSLSAGIASNILNRSLGLSSEEVTKMNTSTSQRPISADSKVTPSIGAMANASKPEGPTGQQKRRFASDYPVGEVGMGLSNAMLADHELDTLYSRFQKRRLLGGESGPDGKEMDWMEEGRETQKLRLEEAKVRALNRNGRVDYSIQE